MVGIVETRKAFLGIAELAADAISLVRNGIGFGSFAKILEILSDIKVLAEAAQKALPELMDIDEEEAGELATAAYQAIRRILEAVQGH